jgi:hypothetical protein
VSRTDLHGSEARGLRGEPTEIEMEAFLSNAAVNPSVSVTPPPAALTPDWGSEPTKSLACDEA